MTNYNNYSMRKMPSVHYGRQNINARYQQNACNAAQQAMFSPGQGLFMPMPTMPMMQPVQPQIVNYNVGQSESYSIGNLVGSFVGILKNFFG